MNLTPDQLDRLTRNILASLKEQDRLRALSSRELIAETLGLPCSDYPQVIELMDRVLPGWSETMTEEELS
jgi:hypothetical protein